MPDNFHVYIKKQLLDYVEAERKRGVPLEEIEKALLNAGHDKNILEEVKAELMKEEQGKKAEQSSNPVEKDIGSQLKNAFAAFMAKASNKEIDSAKKDATKAETEEIINEVIEEAEIIEEKTMLESAAFFVYIVMMGLVILFTAGATQSGLTSVIIGFFPAILSIFLSFMALRIADNAPLYMFIPLGISSAFYALVRFSGIGIFGAMDPEGLSIVNFLAGFIFNTMIVYVRFVKPKQMKKRVIKKDNRPFYRPTHGFKKREEIDELKKEFKI